MIKTMGRSHQLRWMSLAIGMIILLGSCRTIDCGCPMALEEERIPVREMPEPNEAWASPDSDSDVGLFR